jgi:Fur family ferric uptake transcriptional regulator
MKHADEIKSSGLKATLPRIKILEVFQRTQRRHMTAEDVYKACWRRRRHRPGHGLPRADAVRAGRLLTRSNFESGKAVFELNEGQHHDHLVCLDCGRVEEFYDAEIETAPAHRDQRAASSCRSTRWRCTRAAPRPTARTAASSRATGLTQRPVRSVPFPSRAGGAR